MHVAALFRYPVKGFTREPRDWLDVLPGGRIAGDRVLALRFAASTVPDDLWGTKLEGVALVNTPGLARIRLAFDDASHRLVARVDDEVLFDGPLDAAGRGGFAAAVAAHVLATDDNPLAGHPERLPLRLVGDGASARYQDREPGYVTLHARASVAAVARAVGEADDLTERRFRSNISLDGLDAWNEQRLVGRRLRIGEVELTVANPVVRCLATHANPDTGLRDVSMMKKLLELWPSERPSFAVLTTSTAGGRIRVGDEVTVLD